MGSSAENAIRTEIKTEKYQLGEHKLEHFFSPPILITIMMIIIVIMCNFPKLADLKVHNILWSLLCNNILTKTHIFSLDLTGMLERATIRLVFATLILNEAFISGSSKHGKTRRAFLGDILVAANHLQHDIMKQLDCCTQRTCYLRD